MQIFDLVVDEHTHSLTLKFQTALDGVVQVEERLASLNTDILVGVLAIHLEFIIFLHDFPVLMSLWGAKVGKNLEKSLFWHWFLEKMTTFRAVNPNY
jgi:hypothetical protein